MALTLLLMAIVLWETDEMSIKFAFIFLIEALRLTMEVYLTSSWFIGKLFKRAIYFIYDGKV